MTSSRFGSRHEITCADAVRLIDALLDQGLAAEPLARLRRHLAGCEHCDEHLKQLQLVIRVVAEVGSHDRATVSRAAGLIDVYRAWRSDQRPG